MKDEKTSNEERKTFEVTKAIELIDKVNSEPEPKFIWKTIPEGSTGLITGVAKTGKTTFAENLAISLAVGRKEFFNGSMDGKPRKVLFANLEESYRIRSRRNQKQINQLEEFELELFRNNYFSTPTDFPQYLVSDEDWKIFRDYIIECDPEIVLIDSLSHLYLGDIEKSSTAQLLTKRIRFYLGDLGITTIIIHHNVKGNEKPVDQDSIAGSRFITQEFEYAIGFANIPTGGNYACSLFNKYCENDAQVAMTYAIDTHNWLNYTGTQNKFSLYKEESIDRRVRSNNADAILRYVVTLPEHSVKTSDLDERFLSENANEKMSRATLFNNLNKLVSNNMLDSKHGNYTITKQGLKRINDGDDNL